MSFSPDGWSVATAGKDGTVRVWPISTAGEPVTFGGLGASVESVSFSPNGQRLVTAHDDGTVRVWRCDAIHRGVARATDSARGVTGTVRLGVMGMVGAEIRDVIEVFRGRYPACDVALQEIVFSDPFAPLRAGEVDLAVLWRSVRERYLVEGPVVLTEGRVLAVWSGHELADRSSVSMEDFADEPLPCYYSPPGVVFVPVHDAPVREWAVVWDKDALHPRGRGFVEVARELGPRGFGTVRQ